MDHQGSRNGSTLLAGIAAALLLLALWLVFVPFSVQQSGWFGYTPMSDSRERDVTGRSLAANCEPAVVSAWDGYTPTVKLEGKRVDFLTPKTCEPAARSRFYGGVALLLGVGVVAAVTVQSRRGGHIADA